MSTQMYAFKIDYVYMLQCKYEFGVFAITLV